MDRHSSIEKAERLIIKNWGTILPVLILMVFVNLANMKMDKSYFGEAQLLKNIVFDFMTFPIFYIGVTNFMVKLINDKKASLFDLFEVFIKKPVQSCILSLCYVSITSMMLVLVNYMSVGDINLWNVMGIIVNGFLTVKFVLAIYIFSQDEEKTAIGALESAWVKSKGYSLELMKIYLTVLMVSFFLSIGINVIVSLLSAFLNLVGDPLELIIVRGVSLIAIVIVIIFENATFSCLAVDIFGESMKPNRFLNGGDGKGTEKLAIKFSLLLSFVVIVGFVSVWSPSYIKGVNVDEGVNNTKYESLFDTVRYEYKAPKDAKYVDLAILVLNDDGMWDTVEYMEKSINPNQRKGTLNVTFNNEDGFYDLNIDIDGENYNKKGSNERLKFEFDDYVTNSIMEKRYIGLKEHMLLGFCYKGKDNGIVIDEVYDLMELEGSFCMVVSFGD